MKKILLGLFIIGSFNSFASEKMSENTLDNIRKEAYTFYNGSEAQDYIRWQVSSYNKMYKKLDSSNLTKEQKDSIVERLKGMYRSNYIKQNSVVDNEIARYSEINTKVEENNKLAEKNIEIIKKNNIIPEKILKTVIEESKSKYPNNYEKQQSYLEGFVENYNLLKK